MLFLVHSHTCNDQAWKILKDEDYQYNPYIDCDEFALPVTEYEHLQQFKYLKRVIQIFERESELLEIIENVQLF